MRPEKKDIKEVTEEFPQALEKLVQSKFAAAQSVRAADKQAQAQYIWYTPSKQALSFNCTWFKAENSAYRGGIQRDPMGPPKFNISSKIPVVPFLLRL